MHGSRVGSRTFVGKSLEDNHNSRPPQLAIAAHGRWSNTVSLGFHRPACGLDWSHRMSPPNGTTRKNYAQGLRSLAQECSISVHFFGSLRRICLGTALAGVCHFPSSILAFTDGNSNQYSDIWEHAYGLAPSPASDQDGDGLTASQEHCAGTDPANPGSFLRVDQLSIVGGALRLGWKSVPGKKYQVQAASEPGASPSVAWAPFGPASIATSDWTTLDLPLSTTFGGGGVPRSLWTGTTDWGVAQIKTRVANNTPPNLADTLTTLETQSEWGSNYGQYIRGWIIPPTTGSYTFYIASDDDSELWLSTNLSSANKSRIARVSGWTDPREWTKYTSQTSAARTLQANVPYYFEVWHHEGEGGDNLAVAWQGPGLVRQVIAGNALASSPQTLQALLDQGRLFLRLSVCDTDSDGDSVTDYEENILGLDPHNITTTPRRADASIAAEAIAAPSMVTLGSSATRAYESSAVPASITFFRSGGIRPITIHYNTGGTASPGSDYEALPGTVTLGAGARNVTLPIVPVPDNNVEPAESVSVSLLPDPAYVASNPGQLSVTIDDAPDQLYIATLRGESGLRTGSFGYAALRVAGNALFGQLALSFSNLTSHQTGAEIYITPSGSGNGVVRQLPIGQVPSLRWEFEPAGGFTRDAILTALQEGRLHIRLLSTAHPSGEATGIFASGLGWQVMPAPPTPPTLPPGVADFTDAARFLTQATFGPRLPEITALQSQGFDAWLNAQFALPPSLHLPYVQARRQEMLSRSGGSDDGWQRPRQEAWWQNAIDAPDQLRQRMALALSEILVVSDIGVLDGSHEGITNYYDMLLQHAFGNYRGLLEAVTLSPIMGQYLSMARNQKPDVITGSEPDENYAREVEQLLSIGLTKLHPDGSMKLSTEGLPIPTYTQSTIVGFAHVFTGWSFPYTTLPPGWDADDYFLWGDRDEMRPMVAYENFHDTGAKVLLDGFAVPAGQSAQADLEMALDHLFNHPNVGPFIARQLIQRFVTSNPSPGYISRVASNFDNNGAGVRGDLKAVLRAVLLDYEARSPSFLTDTGYGKQREPLIRMAQLYRAFHTLPPKPGDPRYFIDQQYGLTHQAALKSPSVFNFFQPGYVPPGPVAAAGLFAPEFQITSETSTVVQANSQAAALHWGTWTGEISNPDTDDYYVTWIDISEETAFLTSTGPSRDQRVQNLIDHLSKKLLCGRMSSGLRASITGMFDRLIHIQWDWYFDETSPYFGERMDSAARCAIYLVFASPEYAIQK